MPDVLPIYTTFAELRPSVSVEQLVKFSDRIKPPHLCNSRSHSGRLWPSSSGNALITSPLKRLYRKREAITARDCTFGRGGSGEAQARRLYAARASRRHGHHCHRSCCLGSNRYIPF